MTRMGEGLLARLGSATPFTVLAFHCWFAFSQATPASPPSGLNILLISVDTLRADHLTSYGHDRPTSPNIDRLAGTGILFKQAISQSPWTLPSIASMHSSLYSSQHGATRSKTRLPDHVETLAEALQTRGYQTVAVVSHIFVNRNHGLAQGFEVFDESLIGGHQAVTSQDLTEHMVGYLEKLEPGRPFFGWVHYFDPHFDYVRHPRFDLVREEDGPLSGPLSSGRLELKLRRAKAAGKTFPAHELAFVESVYDEEIAHTDEWIGALLESLRRLDLAKSTVVILTADHGEYFLERGRFFHGRDVYQALVHVPLIIGGAVPEQLRGVEVARPIEVSSIPYTAMALAGFPGSDFQGQDLIQCASSESLPPRPVFTEGTHAAGTGKVGQRAVILSGWKLIQELNRKQYSLFHLPSDPAERRDLLIRPDDAIATVFERLKGLLADFPPSGAVESESILLDDATRKQLEALGYVQ